MSVKVLVVYATKYGATEGIARKIAAVLQEAGLEAEVLPAGQVGSLAPYQAIVLGSAVYIGRWRKEAAKFLQDYERELTARPLWLFSSGPTGEGDPVELTKGWRIPQGLQAVADRISVRDIAVFHGALDVQKMNFLEKWIVKKVKAPIGDFRDWQAISAWASDIAAQLKGEVS